MISFTVELIKFSSQRENEPAVIFSALYSFSFSSAGKNMKKLFYPSLHTVQLIFTCYQDTDNKTKIFCSLKLLLLPCCQDMRIVSTV
jgi:hypothetical protein